MSEHSLTVLRLDVIAREESEEIAARRARRVRRPAPHRTAQQEERDYLGSDYKHHGLALLGDAFLDV